MKIKSFKEFVNDKKETDVELIKDRIGPDEVSLGSFIKTGIVQSHQMAQHTTKG